MSDQLRSQVNASATHRTMRNPFELWLVAACVLVGLTTFLPLNVTHDGAVDRALPGLAFLWYLGIFLAGLTTLVGIVIPVRTLRAASYAYGLERVGLCVLTGFLVGYGTAIEVIIPRNPAGILLLSLAGAAVVRVHQIGRELKTLTQSVCVMRNQLEREAETEPDVD